MAQKVLREELSLHGSAVSACGWASGRGAVYGPHVFRGASFGARLWARVLGCVLDRLTAWAPPTQANHHFSKVTWPVLVCRALTDGADASRCVLVSYVGRVGDSRTARTPCSLMA